MARKKLALSPEQKKEKRNKRLFTVFMTLVFLACAVVGIWKISDQIHLPNINDMTAFQDLKQNSYSIENILLVQGLTDKDLSGVSANSLIAKLEGAGLDYFTDGALDSEKWDTSQDATSNVNLTDVEMGVLLKAFYPNMRAFAIAVESANTYKITILERVNLSTFVTNDEIKDLLPASAWVTSACVVHVDGGDIVIDSSKVLAYNELRQEKSDVITSTLNHGTTKITEYSTSRFILLAKQFAAKTSTSFSFSTSNIIFSI